MFLHGGPGGGSSKDDAVFFDPKHYRIILFDQRGAGKSTPPHFLENNTTQDLIGDINLLLEHLKIKSSVHIFGGSWGSTLALSYAIAHPERVRSLVLRGIFLARRRDIDIFYQGNAANPVMPQTSPAAIAFSDEWKSYVDFIPEAERENMVLAYHRRLHGGTKQQQLEAAKQWSLWEGCASKLIPDESFSDLYKEPEFALTFARIETHYFLNLGFLASPGADDQNFICENVNVIAEASIPIEIVQGRYDLVCPRHQADELTHAWESVTGTPPPLHIVTAGHNAKEPETLVKLIQITERMKVHS